MEARLAAIEAKLGIVPGKPSIQGNSLEQRLTALKALYESTTDPSLRDTYAESDRLMQELDAGTALTHQTSDLTTPLFYRRQEILSAADDLKIDLDQLMQILHLILVSQPPSNEKRPLRQEEVTQAPIVTVPPISEENSQRLESLKSNINGLSSRAQAVASRVDALLKLHQSLISTASEKMVVANEAIAAKEQEAH
jgi:hypothetical protein